jgi:CDP-diacylglycerol--glycerol-3-phosphate 3-phosphatidyltransferase
MKMVNIPNTLTIARIVVIFIVLILANIVEPEVWPYLDDPTSQALKMTAFILAILAALTDFFDGYLARKYNQVTDFGKLIDPLADKIFVAALMLMMVEFLLIPAWIAVIVISREFLVTGLRMLAVQKGVVISADSWGKAKTVLQMVILLIGGASWIGIFNLQTDILVFGGFPTVQLVANGVTRTCRIVDGHFCLSLWFIWKAFLIGMVLVTVYSGMGYFAKFKDLFASDKKAS